jgi:hypothetical protein
LAQAERRDTTMDTMGIAGFIEPEPKVEAGKVAERLINERGLSLATAWGLVALYRHYDQQKRTYFINQSLVDNIFKNLDNILSAYHF